MDDNGHAISVVVAPTATWYFKDNTKLTMSPNCGLAGNTYTLSVYLNDGYDDSISYSIGITVL